MVWSSGSILDLIHVFKTSKSLHTTTKFAKYSYKTKTEKCNLYTFNYTLTSYILTCSIGGLKEIRSCVAVCGPSTAISANSPCSATALERASFSFISSFRRLVSISMGATPASTKTHLKLSTQNRYFITIFSQEA